MKLFTFLLAISCIFVASEAFPDNRFARGVSNGINEALEKLRKLILNGNEELGIPVLDPLLRETGNIDLDNSILKVKVNAEDISLTGLGAFDVSNVDITVLPTAVKFEGEFPLLLFTSEKYSLLGKVLNALPIYGNGNAHFEIGKFTFTGVAKVQVGISGVQLRDLQLDLAMSSFKSQTNGMLGGGDIDNVINAMLEDLAPEFFNKYSDFVSLLVGDKILASLNKVLNGMSLADLIDLITGGS